MTRKVLHVSDCERVRFRTSLLRLSMVAISGALSLLVSCAEGPTGPDPIASIVVTPTSQTLASGSSATLTAVALDANGRPLTGRQLTWSSSDAALATLTGPGQVTAGQNRGGGRSGRNHHRIERGAQRSGECQRDPCACG